MSKYTSEADVERLLQVSITATSKPSSADVTEWINGVEGEIDSQALGWDTVEGQGYPRTVYYNVPMQLGHIPVGKGLEVLMFKFKGLSAIRVVLDPYSTPVIKITSLSRRTSWLTENPTWEALTEGYYEGWTETSGTDYLVVYEHGKAGQTIAKEIIIYNNVPEPGLKRLKATIQYGWNLPVKVLKRYATLRVALKVLDALTYSGEPTRIASFVGGDFQAFVNTQLEEQKKQYLEEIKEIERKYFPKGPVGVLRI